MRSFLAIALAPEVLEACIHLQHRLLTHVPEGLRPVSRASMHLTLRFLGDISEERLRLWSEPLKNMSLELKPFQISLGKIGVFPVQGAPRVIYCGLSVPDLVIDLRRRIDSVLAIDDPQDFYPHITIARVKDSSVKREVKRALERLKVEPAQQPVTCFTLYSSVLTPQGPRYQVLEEYRF